MFYDILERKNAFLGKKTRSLKSRKSEIFSKGLTHSFDLKMAIFPSFFRQYRLGNCVLRYSRMNKRLSRLIKQDVQKIEKLRFFQGVSPIFLVQKWPFYPRFF